MARKKKRADDRREIEVVEAYDVYDNAEDIPDADLPAIEALVTRAEVQQYLETFLWQQLNLIPGRTIVIRDRATGKRVRGIASVWPRVLWEECDDE